MNSQLKSPRELTHRSKDLGIALIVVLLALLILSVLTAALVFLARSETMASNNYKLDTQADYLAKAGIQEARNWFAGPRYQAVSQAQAGTSYNVSATGPPYNLWTFNTSPVQCTASACPSVNGTVQLMGIPGTGTSNYPINSVALKFTSDLVNIPLAGDAKNSGSFSISAVLLNYETVNTGTLAGVNAVPVETWLITSRATWSGGTGSTARVGMAEEQAIIQPIFLPSWGNALYGYCSVSMQGSAGVCTDAFNSDLGPYGGGNPSVSSGGCDSNSTNVIKAGAGVGANGSVTLGSNITVSGNVAIGSAPTAGCPTPYGFNGNASSVMGEVVSSPHVDPTAAPTFRAGFPSGASNFNLGANSTTSFPAGVVMPPVPPWPNSSNAPPLAAHSPCMNGDGSCDGTTAHPYEIGSISMSGGGTGPNAPVLNLVGGPDAFHPVVYDIASFNQNQGSIVISGYVVLNIQSSFSIGGQGLASALTCAHTPCSNVPPAAVQVNAACTGGCISLGGNGAVSMLVNAPNADVTLGGGGSGGYFIGGIQANNISVQGGYPVHYDVQLNRAGGTVGTMVASGYTRKKL
jgi:Tfp pilus assembly protein PilX